MNPCLEQNMAMRVVDETMCRQQFGKAANFISSLPLRLMPSINIVDKGFCRISDGPKTNDVLRVGGARSNIQMLAKKDQKGQWKTHSPRIENRVARFRYDIIDSYECGIELLGTEVKSVRNGQMNIREGYARVKDDQIYLHNVNISTWQGSHKALNHEPLRPRRLLLHKRFIRKLASKQSDSGLTIIPMKAYFSSNGYLKVEIALAKGKKLHDKREDEKKREAQRDIQRAVKSFVAR